LLFQMRLENVFLRVRPIVLSLARSTMFSSTTLFSNNRNVCTEIELGGFECFYKMSQPRRVRSDEVVYSLLGVGKSDQGAIQTESLDDMSLSRIRILKLVENNKRIYCRHQLAKPVASVKEGADTGRK
jgi:hypothetical protein